MSTNKIALTNILLSSLPYDSLPDEQKLELTVRSRVAVVQGMVDSAPVNPVKVTTDLSGAYGDSEYFAALGYA